MDAAAFETAYTAHYPYVLHWLQQQTRSREWAEDLTSATFERAWKAWSGFDGRYPQAWLFRIALNQLIDEKRRRAVICTQSLDAPLARGGGGWNGDGTFVKTVLHLLDHGNVEGAVVTRECLLEWWDAVQSLDDRSRTALELRQAGLSSQEIASRMDCTRGAVKSLLFRARERLSTYLPGNWYPERRDDSRPAWRRSPGVATESDPLPAPDPEPEPIPDRFCRWCHDLLDPATSAQQLYCSRRHQITAANAAWRERRAAAGRPYEPWKAHRRIQRVETVCPHCAGVVTTVTFGVYCSARCRALSAWARKRAAKQGVPA